MFSSSIPWKLSSFVSCTVLLIEPIKKGTTIQLELILKMYWRCFNKQKQKQTTADTTKTDYGFLLNNFLNDPRRKSRNHEVLNDIFKKYGKVNLYLL